jgi:hypothetical protein
MANFAHFDERTNRYVLGPPVYIVSENTDPRTTINPAFELSYWRFGLRVAQTWKERLSLPRDGKWDDVLKRLSPLPVQDGLYVTYEGIPDMWTRYTFEHPALTGVFGMLPGDGVDTAIFKRTLEKVISVWDFNRTWGWDFPMIAMAAARSGYPEKAIDMLLHPSAGFQFDEHGLATGGPFPYFPSNGALLAAVAMMAAGWDGAPDTPAPGFPNDGSWVVEWESQGGNTYMVNYSVNDAHFANGSVISAIYDGNAIYSGATVPGGKRLTVTAAGAGANNYAYAWSGDASGIGATWTTIVNAEVNAVCTVTGSKLTGTENFLPEYPLKAWTLDGNILVSGLAHGKTWNLYSVSGDLVKQGIADRNPVEISLNVQGVYIIQSELKTLKVVYQ